MKNELEQMLLEKWSGFEFDSSHNHQHISDVLNYARGLGERYGADEEILIAAVILHDLGRSNKTIHGQESKFESVRLARPILQEIGFPQQKIDQVCVAIEDHDQTEPARTLEGKILKDADFLSGLGARGIWRIFIWTFENGGNLEDVMFRLKIKMPQRITALELPESKKIAEKEYQIVELFVAEMEKPLPEIGGDSDA